MDGLMFEWFRKCNKQHSKRHSSLCYSSSTVNPVIWSEKQIYLCSSDCCAARVGKKYSCKQAQQRRFENVENVCRVTSSQGNRREPLLNQTMIFFPVNGQCCALDVHHQLPMEIPVSCLSWSPLVAPASMGEEGGLPTLAHCVSWSLLSSPCVEFLALHLWEWLRPRGQHLLLLVGHPPSISQHFSLRLPFLKTQSLATRSSHPTTGQQVSESKSRQKFETNLCFYFCLQHSH